MKETRHLLVKGAAWVAATRVLVSVLGFLSTLILARLLVPADFGLVAIATSISSIIIAITELSLAQALVQHRAPDDTDYDTAFTLTLIRAGILATLIALAAVPAAAVYGDGRLTMVMLVVGASTLFSGIQNPRMVVFQRSLVFHQEFFLAVSQKLVGLLVAWAIAVIYHSYWALILGSVATQGCAVIVSYVLVRHRPRLTLARWRGLMSFSIWLTLTWAVRVFNWRMDTLALAGWVDARSLGYYTMADNLSSLASRETVAPIATTLLPAFSRIAGDRARLNEAYRRSSTLLCAAAMVAGTGFAVSAEPLIPLLLGAKWRESVPMIQLLSVMVALSSFGWPMIPLGTALAHTRRVFLAEATGLAVRVPMLFAGLWAGHHSTFGVVIGAICGRTIGTWIGTWINMRLVRNLIDLPVGRQLRDVVRVAAGCAAMVGAGSGLLLLLPRAEGTVALMGQSVSVVALCGATLLLVTGTLWRLAGKPEGPEAEVASLLARYLPARLRKSTSA